MAILFMDGAERGPLLGQWTSNLNNYWVPQALPTVGGMTGSYCLGTDNASAYLEKTLAASQSSLYLSFKYFANEAATSCIVQFRDSAGTIILTVGRNATTYLAEIFLGTYNGSLLDTGGIPILTDTVNAIEIKYVPLNSGGECTVKINGVTDATYTGDTTNGLENVQSIRIGYNGGGTTDNIRYDDFIISDSGWIGNAYIQQIVPTGAGDSTQWTPSTGANYTCVDETTASDTDYITTNNYDYVDLYTCGDLTGTISSIIGVNAMARMKYEGTPTPSKQKIAIKVNGTEYYGDDVSPTLSFVNYYKIWSQNPDDSAAWESADINAIQIGVKAIA